MQIETIVLESGAQKLQLVPAMGGGVSAWEWNTADGVIPLFRPWDGVSHDIYSLACFPLVPWSNRITQGGFEQDGVFYPIALNRDKEPYPIHGDGWLQQWQVSKQSANSLELSITSRCFAGNPYEYRCTQTFTLLPDGLEIALTVTHLGAKPLPYGLGLHPYFLRDDDTRLRSKADAVWLSGDDPIPTELTQQFPAGWDYNQSAPLALNGTLVDNCFTGWDGTAVINCP
ncbi:MAG: aldose 1-epimerase, partial [Pseudomonadota bacterium]